MEKERDCEGIKVLRNTDTKKKILLDETESTFSINPLTVNSMKP
jgi:hypothetical protein